MSQEDQSSKSLVVAINEEINLQLSDPKTCQALLATTFKKLNATLMKQAIMEGMIRGFTFKDFLEKNIYALPFGKGYSLITSIDYARKRAQRGGVAGKSKPTYTDDPGNGKVRTCAVTIYTKGGSPEGFTAEVYFDEYYKKGKTWEGKYTPSMWDEKPRTMLAKVAEMHALRMACPEELSQSYIEEEIGDEPIAQETAFTKRLHEVEGNNIKMGNFLKDHAKEDKAGASETPAPTESSAAHPDQA